MKISGCMAADTHINADRNLPRMGSRSVSVLVVIAVLTLLYVSNDFLTKRFTENFRTEAQVNAAVLSASVKTTLQQHALLPPLLARDPFLIRALQTKDYASTSQRLIELTSSLGDAQITLLDISGRVVASTERRQLGELLEEQNFFVEALRDNITVFSIVDGQNPGSQYGFYYSQMIRDNSNAIGVVAVALNARALEENWRRRNNNVVITDTGGEIILASNPFWRNKNIDELVSNQPAEFDWPSRILSPSPDSETTPYVYIYNRPLLRSASKVEFRGWTLTYFATLEDVRAEVNTILALELMVFSILIAAAFFVLSKQQQIRSAEIEQESNALRRLNERLSNEIAERKRIEKNLQEAEQSLEQASRLAALGHMSAAVSHELNQPLAAMRTYLAGARLLLKRKRQGEADTSLGRIDELIERMGTITRQLKSFARKSDGPAEPVDLRGCVGAALMLMTEPLGTGKIKVTRTLPDEPVMVVADPVRVEQIIVNLLRNAVDALKDVKKPTIDILLVAGRQISLSVRDNGSGIKDLDNLFEPFHTTKKPGEGLGLGLALSAGIAKELGGGLSARNAMPNGAIFELILPRVDHEDAIAAQ